VGFKSKRLDLVLWRAGELIWIAAAVLCPAARSPETLTWQRELVLGLWDNERRLFLVLLTVQKKQRGLFGRGLCILGEYSLVFGSS
jgi:hypothetical protein